MRFVANDYKNALNQLIVDIDQLTVGFFESIARRDGCLELYKKSIEKFGFQKGVMNYYLTRAHKRGMK